MTQAHCLSCPAWSSLREDLDLADIKDLVIYFKRMMDERDRVYRETALHNPVLDHPAIVEGARKQGVIFFLASCGRAMT